jgi:hypothetical protein
VLGVVEEIGIVTGGGQRTVTTKVEGVAFNGSRSFEGDAFKILEEWRPHFFVEAVGMSEQAGCVAG